MSWASWKSTCSICRWFWFEISRHLLFWWS